MENRKTYTELDILINLEHQLANHKWNDMYQLLADLSVMVYHQVDYILSNPESYPLFRDFAKLLQSIRTQTRGSLDTYTPKVLSGYMLGRLKSLVRLQQLKEVAKYLIVIGSVNDDGSIVLNDEWASTLSSSWGIPSLESSATAVPSTSKEQQPKPAVMPQTRISKAKTDAERRLEKFWWKLTEGNFDYQYFWRNKITSAQYAELKNRLQECAYEQKNGFAKRYGRVVAFYVAEWYKREYNGNDGKDNALKDLRLNFRPEEVWKYSGLPESFLYQRKNKMYLFSLYVLGGLPINYLIHKQFDKIFKEIAATYRQKSSEESIDANVFINNYALQEATRSQWGSLHMYFDSLLRGEYPFAQEDYDLEPFRTFISQMEEWKPMRKKFQLEWVVEGNMNVTQFRRYLRLYVTPEYNGERNKSVSYGRISRWGITTETKSFNLYLLFNDDDVDSIDEEAEHLTFYNTYDGYFTGRMSKNYYSFHDIPDGNIYKVSLCVKVSHIFKEIFSFDVNDYLQLFETGRYSVLSDRKSDMPSYLLLPYDTPIIKPAGEEYPKRYFSENGAAYKLVPVTSSITFMEADGENITVYNKEYDLSIEIAPHPETIKYINGNQCRRHYIDESEDEQTECVPIVFSRDDISVLFLKEDTKPYEVNKAVYTLEYKTLNESSFHKWDDEDTPTGMIKIRVRYEGIQAQITAFALCSGDSFSIKRNCDAETIAIAQDLPLLSVPWRLSTVFGSKTVFKDNMATDPLSDTHDFNFGSETDYVAVPVYRSARVKEVYYDGECIKTLKKGTANMDIRIPFLLKDHYAIRTIGENGVHTVNLKKLAANYLNFRLADGEDPVDKQLTIETIVGNVNLYYCKDPLANRFNGCYIIRGVHDDPDNYHFYYWTMQEDELPELLSIRNDDGSIYLPLNDDQRHDGMIFQSLEGDLHPQAYFAPIILRDWPKDDSRLRKACFLIAAKYRTPFRIFRPVYNYLAGTDSELVDLAMDILYLDKSPDFSDEEKYAALIRFSHEMYFSWPFLNRRTWKDMLGRYKENNMDIVRLAAETLSEKDPETWKKMQGQFDNSKLSLRLLAERLFIMCGKDFSHENHVSLENFSKIYWSHRVNAGYHFAPYTDYRWFGMDRYGRKRTWNDHSDELPEQAVCFMRARPIKNFLRVYKDYSGKEGYKYKYPRIIGFTNKENKEVDDETHRNIPEVVSFLDQLYKDKESFIKIEKFLKKYLYDYNSK